jgi:hypothetical protein
MKSSTIRRSTLSRESMEVIENLAKEQEEESLDEYVRNDSEEKTVVDTTNKAQEIDLLWQNFKATQFSSNSPSAYILLGFAIGVIVSAICFICIGLYATKSGNALHIGGKALFAPSSEVSETIEEQANETQEEATGKVVVPTEEDTTSPSQSEETSTSFDSSKMKKYVVKSGDTGESIIKHYYGSYSPEKAELIMKANNLKNLDRINIDQELLIPVE